MNTGPVILPAELSFRCLHVAEHSHSYRIGVIQTLEKLRWSWWKCSFMNRITRDNGRMPHLLAYPEYLYESTSFNQHQLAGEAIRPFKDPGH